MERAGYGEYIELRQTHNLLHYQVSLLPDQYQGENLDIIP